MPWGFLFRRPVNCYPFLSGIPLSFSLLPFKFFLMFVIILTETAVLCSVCVSLYGRSGTAPTEGWPSLPYSLQDITVFCSPVHYF